MAAKIEWHEGELFPRVDLILTNLKRKPEEVVGFYNQRGRCENHIEEGKHAISWTGLSRTRYVCNQ